MSLVNEMMLQEDSDVEANAVEEVAEVKVVIKDMTRFMQMISSASKATASSDAIPALTQIKLEIRKQIPKRLENGEVSSVKGNALFLTGGDGIRSLIQGHASLEGAADAVLEAEGEIRVLLPSDFASLLPKLTKGEVNLLFGEKQVTIHAGKSEFKLSLGDADLYTSLEPEKAELLTFDAKLFCAALKSSVYAVTKADSGMPVLAGVHILSTERGLKFEATNRSQAAIELLSNINLPPVNMILSSESVDEIVRVFSSQTTIKVSFGTSKIAIAGVGLTLISGTLDGLFPDLAKIVPLSFKSEATVVRDEFEGAIDRALLIGSKSGKSILLAVNKNSCVTINSKSELGKGCEDVAATDVIGEIEIALDPELLLKSIKSFAPFQQVILKFAGVQAPLMIVPVGESNRQAILVPLRTKGV